MFWFYIRTLLKIVFFSVVVTSCSRSGTTTESAAPVEVATSGENTVATSAPATGVHLTGKLTIENASTDLVKDIKIELKGETGEVLATAYSDSKGAFAFSLKGNEVILGKKKYTVSSVFDQDKSGKIRALNKVVDISLFDPITRTIDMGSTSLAEISAIKGIVTFVNGDGQALEDVDLADTEISLPGFSFTGRTNADGLFTILYVPPETYKLRIENKSIIYEQNITVEGGTTLNLGAIVINADVTAPQSPSISINTGADYTNASTVSLTLEANGAADMYITNTPGCIGNGQWVPYNASYPAWTIEPVGTTATVYAKFKDNAGNETQCVSRNITYDATAPSNTAMTVNGGSTYTNADTVTLSLSAIDATEMLITADSKCAGTNWVPYANTYEWKLTETGKNTIYGHFRDKVGNTSPCTSAEVIRDTQAPTGIIEFSTTNTVSSGGKLYQSGTNSKLNLTASDDSGRVEARIGAQSDCSEGTWETFSSTKDWILQNANAANTVYVIYRDPAGNTSSCLSAVIYHDNQAPQGTALFSSSIGVTNSNTHYFGPGTQATVILTATDSISTGIKVLLSSDPSCIGAYNSFSSTSTVSLLSLNAQNRVYLRLKDALENESSCVLADSITHDGSPPAVSAFQFDHSAAKQNVSSGDWFASSASVGLNYSVSDPAGTVQMKVSTDANCSDGTYDSQQAITKTLNSSGPTKVYVRFKDPLGNESNCLQDTIYYDATPPTGLPTGSFKSLSSEVTDSSNITYTSASSKIINFNWSQVSDAGVGSPYKIWLTDDCNGTPSWQPQANTLSWTLPSSEGLKTLKWKIQDALGNTSSCSNGISIYYDNSANGHITSSSTIYTGSATIQLALGDDETVSGAGLSEMKISSNDCTGGTWEAFANIKVWTHNQVANSIAPVCAQFKDNVGNVSSACSCINAVYDKQAPSAIPTFDSGLESWDPAQTPTFSWTNAVDALSGIDKYQIKIGTTSGGSEIADYADCSASPCRLPFVTPSNPQVGSTIYFYPTIRAVDNVGNVGPEKKGSGFWLRNYGKLGLSGVLDTNFSTAVDGGRNTSAYNDVKTYTTKIEALSLQDDGKILACGQEYYYHWWQNAYSCGPFGGSTCYTNYTLNTYSSLLYRIGINGGRDSTFASGGSLYTESSSTSTTPNCTGVTFLSNASGSAVTGQTANGNILMKFISSLGSVNSTMTTSSGYGWGVLPRKGSSALALAYADSSNSNLAITTTDGTGFASTTAVTASPWTGLTHIIEQDDGKIIVGGPISGGIKVVRFDSDGATSDATFTSTTMTVVTDITLQKDGKILIAGGQKGSRLKSDLTIDTAFGSGGYTTHTTGCSSNAVLVQDDGSILYVGTCSGKMSIWLTNSTATALVSSFATSGMYTYSTTSEGYAALMQSYGTLIVAGQVSGTTSAVFRIK